MVRIVWRYRNYYITLLYRNYLICGQFHAQIKTGKTTVILLVYWYRGQALLIIFRVYMAHSRGLTNAFNTCIVHIIIGTDQSCFSIGTFFIEIFFCCCSQLAGPGINPTIVGPGHSAFSAYALIQPRPQCPVFKWHGNFLFGRVSVESRCWAFKKIYTNNTRIKSKFVYDL